MKAILLLMLACGVAAAQTTSAQASPAGPPNVVYAAPTLAMPGAPIGGISIMAHESSFVSGKPVTGAPYSAEQVTEHVQTLADGNRIVNTTTTKVYRDSQGRTRTETTLPAPPDGPAPPVMITIHDSVAGVTYFLNSDTKTAQKLVLKPVEMAVDVQKGDGLPALRQLAPIPPGASGAQMGGGQILISSASNIAKPDVQSQDLGSQVIQGITATGTRTTMTIPAGAIGNEQPIETTSERWFSPALQVIVKSVNTDPRIGQSTETLNNLSRSEPDPSLFQVPSDYTVTESKGPDVRTFVFKKQP